jgi:hypothetical protein
MRYTAEACCRGLDCTGPNWLRRLTAPAARIRWLQWPYACLTTPGNTRHATDQGVPVRTCGNRSVLRRSSVLIRGAELLPAVMVCVLATVSVASCGSPTAHRPNSTVTIPSISVGNGPAGHASGSNSGSTSVSTSAATNGATPVPTSSTTSGYTPVPTTTTSTPSGAATTP